MMSFRLKTTNDTAEKLKFLHNATGITPNILSRIAVAFSLQIESQPEPVQGESNGIEFNRHTLTGEMDVIYKSLIKQHLGRSISERDYFPDLFNAHLTRGIQLVEQEYQYAGNYAKFLDNLLGISLDSIKEHSNDLS